MRQLYIYSAGKDFRKPLFTQLVLQLAYSWLLLQDRYIAGPSTIIILNAIAHLTFTVPLDEILIDL